MCALSWTWSWSSTWSWTWSLLVLLLACGAPPRSAAECTDAAGLVFTEVMPDPAGTDRGRQWFEVRNAGDVPVEVLGLVLVAGSGAHQLRHEVTDYLVAPPGGRIVVADGPLPFANHVWPGLSLPNVGGSLAIECAGREVARLDWGSPGGPPAPPPGASLQRSPWSDDDGPAAWCPAPVSAAYDEAGDLGTPGSPEAPCGVPHTCLDGNAYRFTVPPAAGSVVVTEVFAVPADQDDRDLDWIEVNVLEDADLAGLVVEHRVGGQRHSFALPWTDCQHVTAGSLRVIGGSKAPAGPDGPVVVVPGGVRLFRGGGEVRLLLASGEEVARSRHPAVPDAGDASVELSQPWAGDPAAAADVSRWCRSSSPAPSGGLATPGTPNDLCR